MEQATLIENIQQDKVSFNAYDFARNRHNNQEAARKYNVRYADNYKDAREKACITAALKELPANAKVLDLPCGTGRLSYLIRNMNFQVVGADYSLSMLEEAKAKLTQEGDHHIKFEHQDIFNMTYADNSFDAVVCNRLFHHFPTETLRLGALKELARISKGPITISFYSRNTLSAWWRALKKNFKINDAYHIYISFRQLRKEALACGLHVKAKYFVRRGISAQMYIKLSK